ncbi:MAG: PhzF family phenazine biosynthesis protein [Lewinella sp.]|nr:PhzF family phenazine biosynthesis protein [Lewinella sp.]
MPNLLPDKPPQRMQNLQLFQVDAFTPKLFGGNPAAIVPLPQFLPDKLLQAIALENNLSETAYVVGQADGSFYIRWFTPTHEVRLCGHATLGAAHVLLSHSPPEIDKMVFQTNEAGRLSVRRKSPGVYTLDLPADLPPITTRL